MILKTRKRKSVALGAALVLSGLLVGCNPATTPDPGTGNPGTGNPGTQPPANSYPVGNGTITGTVVDQNIGAAVAGSTVTLYHNGQLAGTFTTDANGMFTVTKIASGTYDFKARKAGMAGSDLYGVDATADTTSLRIVQRPAFDTSATTTPAKLVITRADGSSISGTTFTDTLDFKVKTAADSDHVPPVRIVYAQLGRIPGSAAVTSSTTTNNWIYNPAQDLVDGMFDTGGVTLPGKNQPNFLSGYGTAAGEKVFLNIMAVDFNYNYSTYSIPIILKTTSTLTKNTVLAPTKAAATAFTLKQEGSWTTPYVAPANDAAGNATTPENQAAPSGSGIYVDVRWCYTDLTDAAKPYAFDVERATDGTTFRKIGTVSGGNNKNCSADALQRPFNYRDNSADLSVGKTYTYRVVARAANTVASNTTQTTPIGQFQPTLVSPGDEATGVSLRPTFVIRQNQLAIGADGAGYNIRLRDLYNLTGYNLPGSSPNALFRVEEGTGASGNGIPAGQSVVYIQSGSRLTPPTEDNLILTDTASVFLEKPRNFFPVDTTKHEVSLPFSLLLDSDTADFSLQPLRPYQWELYSAIAYKYAPNEDHRVSAYSVYTWPSTSTPVLPIATTRGVNQNFDFVTGDK
ncbi:carboxypeptidase regulatory-like domain-containing protein [Deinococcus cavernae]|uniref:Carboxypeptidase regulatory-like domain-containing protein n=1 Tax=Deinococcus cavernae TaxID=2320857 RepID=A0A418V4T4_9DEIO|nr:carboxypeptidase-like regulatory domain-containing protein [Deinococcus cavernae]RJF71035.1 carboxypeptidase regulatory-like domain-containing protein [Deinococcus cavernae]